MQTEVVTMVRIYLSEGEAKLAKLLKRLHEREKVRGVTAFRGIAGFGASGKIHTANLLDVSLDLPVVIEFFDTPGRVDEILEHIHKEFAPGHIVQWSAQMHV
jgi:PII-like signaling protein